MKLKEAKVGKLGGSRILCLGCVHYSREPNPYYPIDRNEFERLSFDNGSNQSRKEVLLNEN